MNRSESKCSSVVAEGLIMERQKAKEETERLIAKAILQERGNIQAQISTQIENAIANVIPSQVDASVRSYMFGHIPHVHPAQLQTSSVLDHQYQLYLAMKADPQLQQLDIAIWLALQMKFERNTWKGNVLEREDSLVTSLVSNNYLQRMNVLKEQLPDGVNNYQQKVNLTAPTMTFPGIEDHEMFSIIYEPVHGIIYKNNLTKDEAEYLKLFEEEIEERLKHRRQIRRWEVFVNGRPLGPRRERTK
ncbi:hypothetical protein Tco_0307369 [Tanacetum coccineum]